MQSNLFDYNALMEMVNVETVVGPAPVITVDVFDTLLKRRLLNQENTWKEYSRYFAFFRVLSEKIARHLHRRLMSREVTLRQIYRFMPSCYGIAEELVREKASLEIDPVIERAILELQEQGKRVILISDTYYSEDNLRYFLQEAKFDVGLLEIVASSEYGINKRRGLFTEVQKSFSLEFHNWIHVGDDLQADHLAPNALGIITLLYVNHINQFLESRILSPKGIERLEKINGPEFVYNISRLFQKVQNEISSDYMDFVSTVIVRPIVRHSAMIIDDSERMRCSDAILYCSRDGWLFYNAHIMFQEKSPSALRLDYFKTSRTLRNQPAYRRYIDGLTNGFQTIGIFDLGWKGSTLKYLEKAYPAIRWKGYFLTSTYSGNSESENLVEFGVVERINILRSREFLEILFPAPTSSFSKMDIHGVPEPADIDFMANQLDVDKICFNVLNRVIDFKELEFEDAVTLIKLLAIYPGSAWVDRMSNYNFDSSGESFIPLVTNDWSKLLTRNKILWPFSAQPKSSSMIRMMFRSVCLVKEILQKVPFVKNAFIG